MASSDTFSVVHKKQVLALNSYHKGLIWTDNIVKGIEEVFASNLVVTKDRSGNFFAYEETLAFIYKNTNAPILRNSKSKVQRFNGGFHFRLV